MPADRPLYFDHNASTPVLPDVVEAMLPYFTERFGNPSSQHAFGREARAAVDLAREKVASALGASSEEIVFTSGGTESDNLAIFGATAARPFRHHIVSSVIEHPAVKAPLGHLERGAAKVSWLGVDPHGRVRAEEAIALLSRETLLVTLMHANNETGAVQPIEPIARAAREVGALVHTDASQSIGKVPVDVRRLGVDLLTVAGHKVYAPKGVGALYVRSETILTPRLLGASHERGMRPGTENVALVVGLGTALEIAARDLEREARRLRALTERMWRALSSAIEGVALNGPPLTDEGRLPNTLSVRFPGVTGLDLLAGAPLVAASTGSACHQGEVTASAGILAMGIPEREAIGTVRLSLGRLTDEAAVDAAAAALVGAFESLRPSSSPRPA